MNETLTVLAVLYVIAGCAVYALSDTHTIGSRIESRLLVVPWGIVERYLFLFVVAAWPLWLLFAFFSREEPSE